jgi:hypothetical protein
VPAVAVIGGGVAGLQADKATVNTRQIVDALSFMVPLLIKTSKGRATITDPYPLSVVPVIYKSHKSSAGILAAPCLEI